MDLLVTKLAAFEIGTDDEELLEFLSTNNINISKSVIKRTMRQQDTYKCLSCLYYADSVKELRTHLKKEKHIKKKEIIKAEMTKFLTRISNKYLASGSPDTTLASFDPHRLQEYSPGEQRTFIAVCLEFSRMIHFGCE